jgi:hypothetical protein
MILVLENGHPQLFFLKGRKKGMPSCELISKKKYHKLFY